MLVEIKENTREKAMKMFLERLEDKRKKKGYYSFNSRAEVLGKATEEFYEFIEASHERDDDHIIEEELDLMITAFWGICSKLEGAW